MSAYVNEIAPEHDRTSCDDENLYNAAYGIEDFDGRGRCYRCTLLMAQAKYAIELNSVDDQELGEIER